MPESIFPLLVFDFGMSGASILHIRSSRDVTCDLKIASILVSSVRGCCYFCFEAAPHHRRFLLCKTLNNNVLFPLELKEKTQK